MNLTSYVQDRQLTITLTGEIDHHCAREIMKTVGEKIDLYLPLRRMNTLQGKLLLQNSPPQPYKVLRAAGIEKITEIREECTR